jgi:hypothetical protein
MKDVQKVLTSAEKAQLIAAADVSLSGNIKSVRRKMIEEGYLTSVTQVSTFDKLLWAVKSNENSSMAKVLFDQQVMNKQIAFVNNIRELFKEGWMLSRAFRFYTGAAPIQELNSWKLKDIVRIIETKDRSMFEKLDLLDQSKRPEGKEAPKKPFSKPKSHKPPRKVETKTIPIIIKK